MQRGLEMQDLLDLKDFDDTRRVNLILKPLTRRSCWCRTTSLSRFLQVTSSSSSSCSSLLSSQELSHTTIYEPSIRASSEPLLISVKQLFLNCKQTLPGLFTPPGTTQPCPGRSILCWIDSRAFSASLGLHSRTMPGAL